VSHPATGRAFALGMGRGCGPSGTPVAGNATLLADPTTMKRAFVLHCLVLGSLGLQAAWGGPDQYGYLWKDNAEPDGPVYDWIDITTTGTQLSGLADDNVVGPFIMTGNMPFYWYDVKNVWIGSNGYIVFNPGNMAANFPVLPMAGAVNDFMAAYMADLTFTGTGNVGQVFAWDSQEMAVFSWINVPFWSVNAPGWSGSNTFQIILNKVDSTITFQYQSNSGTNGSNGPVVGIESVTGDIGLARSQSLLPSPGYAVRFYNPAEPLLDITDAAADQVGEPGTGGMNMSVNGSLPLQARVKNTGNQTITGASVTGTVLDPFGSPVYTETLVIPDLEPGLTFDPPFTEVFTPTLPGTYQQRIIITGITNEFVASNNILSREVGVYDNALLTNQVDWAGPADNLAGIGWNGGDGGVATYIIPPAYPCQITAYTIRIASNAGTDFTLKIYDDDGMDGAPGTLLDSAYITAANGGTGNHTYPLLLPIEVTSGGYYVEWYMQGPNVNIAVDVQPPFSYRTFEVLSQVWANYRDRAIQDFHLGLEFAMAPFTDVGCNGLVGITPGQLVSSATTVSAMLKNFGNTPATGFPVHYSFNGGPVTTQTYNGAAIIPGAAAVMAFTQQLQPMLTALGDLCAWTSATEDEHPDNDTNCVVIDMAAAIQDLAWVPLAVVPNPARDRIQVQGLAAGNLDWLVLDPAGRTVMQGRTRSRGPDMGLDVSALANGPYVLQLRLNGLVRQGRFTVQH
jgi:hypothetical protein